MRNNTQLLPFSSQFSKIKLLAISVYACLFLLLEILSFLPTPWNFYTLSVDSYQMVRLLAEHHLFLDIETTPSFFPVPSEFPVIGSKHLCQCARITTLCYNHLSQYCT